MRFILISALLLIHLPAMALTNSQLAQFARNSQLWFGVTSNQLAEPNQFRGSISLVNQSAIALPRGKGNWQLYFHLIRRIEHQVQHGVELQHIQGDLHRLQPLEDFAGLAPGETLNVQFISAPWMVSYSDFMPRAFITGPDQTPHIIANTDTEDLQQFVRPITQPEQYLRNGDAPDQVPLATTAQRYKQQQQLHERADVNTNSADYLQRVIPTPKQAAFGPALIPLTAQWQITTSNQLSNEAKYLQQQLNDAGLALDLSLLAQSGTDQRIKLTLTPDLPVASEGYQLTILPGSITIQAKDSAGAFYAVQTLLALLQHDKQRWLLPQAAITDEPRMGWRGMHYDMARNFHGKDVTLRLIKQMARYKLNKLHLHLTEDEGWRLQIPGLPELTDIGAYRCFDLTEQRCLLTQLGTGPDKTGSGNGYYSVSDFIEILQLAAQHHIEVIPEIDLPGHARAAVVAMKARYQRLLTQGEISAAEYLLSDPLDSSVYLSVQNYNDNSANVCLESTYTFIDKVLAELQNMYQQAGVPFRTFNIGGDEVAAGSWEKSPACAQLISKPNNNVQSVSDLKPYFVSRVAELTHRRGLALAGWEDGLMYDKFTPFNRSHFVNDRVIAHAWDNIWEWGVADRAYRLANSGYDVVLSPGTHMYFDHPHEAHPAERGYYWATRFSNLAKVFGFMPDDLYANADTTRSGHAITDLSALVGRPLPVLEKPENIIGLQGQIWSETIRTAAQLEQMLYPRLLALAERAWHKAKWEQDANQTERQRDWLGFAQRIGKVEYQRLADSGTGFYLPPPGAIVKNNLIQVNTSLPGLTVDISFDGGNSWQHFQTNTKMPAQPVWLRSRLGQAASRAVIVPVPDTQNKKVSDNIASAPNSDSA